MTLTETRPEHAEPDQRQTGATAREGWLSAADHKRIGRYYIAAALAFVVIGGVVGMILSIEQSQRGIQVVGDDYARVFSLHATVSALLFLGPLWTGLATYLVPLQIGSPRLAFSRLQATAFWLYLVGGGLVVVSYLVGTPRRAGLTLSLPIGPRGNDATSLWVMGLMLVSISAVIAAGNLLVTMLKLRTDGMTLTRMPFFSWSALVTSVATLLATPTFIAGLLLLYLDKRYGGDLFARPAGRVVWQHTLWLFGRPEAYLLLLPGLGAASDAVAAAARRRLVGAPLARGAIVAVGILSFASWAASTSASDAVVLPTYSPLTALVVIPFALLVQTWLATVFRARQFRVSLLFVAGGLVLAAFAVINAAVAAVRDVDGGTAWATGHIHVAMFGIPLMLAGAALHHWAPKLWGRDLPAGLGSLAFLLLLGGLLVMGFAYYLLGYDGAPWHTPNLPRGSWQTLAKVGTAGGALTTLGLLALIASVASRARRRSDDAAVAEDEADRRDGVTLEWATASPPPPHNFDTVPAVRSETPLLDAAPAETTEAP